MSNATLYFLRLLASFSASLNDTFLSFAFISLYTFITSRFQAEGARFPLRVFFIERLARRVLAIILMEENIYEEAA